MQFFRDAMSMREIMPELADKPLSELFEPAAGSTYLGIGIVLWLLVVLARLRGFMGRLVRNSLVFSKSF